MYIKICDIAELWKEVVVSVKEEFELVARS
jgi:hypothetical protein